MVLPLIIPIAFAAAGGAAAYAAGGAILTGMAVGWMVGSWLFPMGSQGNDPGGAQLQDVNQSLRGEDMPVLFGTNRATSSIILRDRFKTKTLKDHKGGMFGIGGSNVIEGYRYRIDLVCHYGIPYDTTVGMQAFAGWWDGQIFTGDSFSKFTAQAEGDQPALTPSEARAEVAKFLNQTGDGDKTLTFKSSAMWSSGKSDTPLWSQIDDRTGFNVRWPGTVWCGFGQLSLGDQARIPSITWEIGPEAATAAIEANTGDSTINVSAFGDTMEVSRHLDQYGNLWAWDSTYAVRVISKSGTVLYAADEVDWVQRLNAFTGVDSMFSSSTTRRGTKFISVIMNGLYAAVGFVSYTGTYQMHMTIVNPRVDAGSPEILGTVWCYADGNGPTRGGGRNIEHAHLQRAQDPLVYGGGGALTLSRWQGLVFPDPQGIIAGAYDGGYAASTLGLLDMSTAVYTGYEVPRIEYQFASNNDATHFNAAYEGPFSPKGQEQATMLPMKLDGAMRTVLLQPVTRGHHEYHRSGGSGANKHPAYENSISIVTSAAQGGAFYYVFDVHSADELLYENLHATISTDKIFTFDQIGEPVVCTSRFVDRQGNITMPFSDDYSPTANDLYHPHPHWRKDSDNQWCIAWMKTWNSSEDHRNIGARTKVRGYSYEPNDGVFTEIGAAVNTLTFVDDAVGTGYEAEYSDKGALIAESGDLTFSWIGGTGGAGIDYEGDLMSSDWGTFGCGLATDKIDLTPPEIIRHIMVNTIYGMGFSTDLIDNTTYQSAVTYCTSQGFKVSAIYRTSQDRSAFIEHLLAVYGGFLVWSRGVCKFGFVTASDTVVRTLDNSHHAVSKTGEPPIRVSKGSLQDTFNKVTVNYIDRALAYRKNSIEISDEADIEDNGVRARSFPALFVMKEATAQKIAHRTLWSGLYARDIISGAFGWKDADLEPGDLVWIVDSEHIELKNGVTARMAGIVENKPGLFAYTAIQEDPTFLADQGFVTSETLSSPGNNLTALRPPRAQAVFELPKEFADVQQIFVAWAPNNSAAGANLYTSNASDGTFNLILEQQIAPLAGTIGSAMGADPAFIERDMTLTFVPVSGHTVSSPNYAYTQTFSETPPEDRHDGNQIFLIGSEVCAVESLTVVGSNQYKVGRLYRGWGGTHIHSHAASDVFFWLNAAILFRNYQLAEVGKTLFFKAVPFNIYGDEVEISSVPAIEHTIVGGKFLPQIPAVPHAWIVKSEGGVTSSDDLRGLDIFGVNSGDDVTFTWKDGARCSGFGYGLFGKGGYGDFTTDSSSHNWTVVVVGSGGNDVRSTVVDTGWFVYTHSANVADNGAFGPFAIRVTPVNSYGNAPRTEVKTLSVFQKG